MQLVITEKQLRRLSSQMTEKETVSEEEVDPAAAAPDAGTSSDGEKKTGATKWESGATRGPGNQIGVTKWSDVVGSTLKRGKANPLSEQSDYMMDRRANALLNTIGVRSDKDYNTVNQVTDKAYKDMQFGKVDPHTVNAVIGIAALFIPYVGPLISAGIGMYDAKLYYEEGDKKTAGMVAMFSLLPGIGAVANKIPGVKQLGAKAMAEIGKKLSLGVKLTNPAEVEVVSAIAANRKLIEAELKKASEVTISAAKSNVKKQLVKKAITKKAGTIGKTAAAYTAAGVAYSKGYDKLSGQPKADTKKDAIARLTSSKEKPVDVPLEADKDGMFLPKEDNEQ